MLWPQHGPSSGQRCLCAIKYNHASSKGGHSHCNDTCFCTSIHGIHFDLQLIWPSQQSFDSVKVKNPSQQVEVNLNRVHYLN